MDWRATAAGAMVGVLVGMTGMGGGSILTPLLIVGLGVAPLQAVAAGLANSAVSTVAGAWQHVRLRNVDFRTAALLAAGSVPAALLSVFLLSRLGASSAAAGNAVKMLLGGVLIALGAAMALDPWLARRARRLSAEPYSWLVTAAGAVVGTTTGLTSVGSGSLTTGFLCLATGHERRRQVGTVVFHVMVLTVVAGLAHLALGKVQPALVLSLLAGSIPGVVAGSRLTVRIPGERLRLAQASMLLVLGALLYFPPRGAARPAPAPTRAEAARPARHVAASPNHEAEDDRDLSLVLA
ncbi:MAG TPA: sulfite exporter TauE/SafE family protein, partial [Longimicrobiaceae bacterium]